MKTQWPNQFLHNFWPSFVPWCTTNITNFCTRGLKFSPNAPCWLSMKIQLSNQFLSPFWPLCTTKNTKFAIFGARLLKFSPEAPCCFYVKTQRAVKSTWTGWSIESQEFKRNICLFLQIAICKAAPNDSEDFNLNKNMVPDDLDLNLKEIYQPEDRYWYPDYISTWCKKRCKGNTNCVKRCKDSFV